MIGEARAAVDANASRMCAAFLADVRAVGADDATAAAVATLLDACLTSPGVVRLTAWKQLAAAAAALADAAADVSCPAVRRLRSFARENADLLAD